MKNGGGIAGWRVVVVVDTWLERTKRDARGVTTIYWYHFLDAQIS